MRKNYVIEESELKSLLHDSFKLAALEAGGVDNWEWYGESLHDSIKEFGSFDKQVEEALQSYQPIAE